MAAAHYATALAMDKASARVVCCYVPATVIHSFFHERGSRSTYSWSCYDTTRQETTVLLYITEVLAQIITEQSSGGSAGLQLFTNRRMAKKGKTLYHITEPFTRPSLADY